MATAQKLTPFLWFDSNAEEAVNHYVQVFPGAKLGKVARYGEAGPGPKGSVMTASFELLGLEFTALNGGPHYKFSPATSFVIHCDDQSEVDHYWDKLSAGGQVQQCGWLTDRFGVTWQVVPRVLLELMTDQDAAKVGRVVAAMMKMVKLDIAELKRAAVQG
jgi:predicted 3-demethylubiquinone-9 3-methyltransferase (glyoxalase superfamily)